MPMCTFTLNPVYLGCVYFKFPSCDKGYFDQSLVILFHCSELEIEVIGPTTRTVVEGETIVLLCNLNNGGGAPNVTWK